MRNYLFICLFFIKIIFFNVLATNHESKDNLELDLIGEGGALGEMQPGSSLVFAVLEVCIF